MLAQALLSFLFFDHGFIQISFGIFDEKHKQWNLDTKACNT